ncbi:DNA methylase [Verrucomicrobiia bacterium DG1235]|nr:DNA methylase [Verrucomicrobiae bacterium DG1235]
MEGKLSISPLRLNFKPALPFGAIRNSVDPDDLQRFINACRSVRGKSLHKLLQGDSFELLDLFPPECVQLHFTSIPYGSIVDYTGSGLEFGSEKTYQKFLDRLELFLAASFRLCKQGGCVVLNARGLSSGSGCGPVGSKTFRGRSKIAAKRGVGRQSNFAEGFRRKDFIDLPGDIGRLGSKVGFTWRGDDIWEKTRCLPESVKDRHARVHENLILLTKGPLYKFDRSRLRQLGSKMDQSVLRLPTSTANYGHPATFSPILAEHYIYAATDEGDVVLDAFGGVGSTALAALKHGRHSITMELSHDFFGKALDRLEYFASGFQGEVKVGKPLT